MSMAELIDAVDRITEPSQMTKREALDWLERLSTELDCRMEALKDELRDEE